MAAERTVRIAAVGDLHAGKTPRGELTELFAHAGREADILALCGDLTDHGRPEQMRTLLEELAGVEIPVVAVFGNHDHESDAVDELAGLLRERGIHLLDGENTIIEGVGFAGVKGFAGGFGALTIGPFGERRLKEFVQETIGEALRLETALRTLTAETKVALMHFSPVADTLEGEPEALYPFLGSSRFIPPLENHGARVVFHGHAHYGSPSGRTPAGVDVFNVALPVLRKAGRRFMLWEGPAPERRLRAG